MIALAVGSNGCCPITRWFLERACGSRWFRLPSLQPEELLMSWPLPHDYNEAIQSPATSFSDPGLKQGEATTNAIGLPMPRSGNFADVYEFKCPNDKKWALKCFTREVPGLRERYAAISAHFLSLGHLNS